MRRERGFVLLAVLLAMTLLAVIVADRVARATDVVEEGADAGQEGRFQWERRVSLMPVPEELTPGAGPQLRLYALTVAVRWGRGRTLELASLRTVTQTTAP